jgi:hypothetical protein
MSMDLHVCWQGDFKPSRQALREALAAIGFEATVLHDFADGEGYWPIDIAGYRTGVETYAERDLTELRDLYPVLAKALDGRDSGVTFTFGGDAGECGTALALAAALAQLGDVIIYEPSEGIVFPATRAADEARQMFEVARQEGCRQRDV